MSEQPTGWTRYVPIFGVLGSYRREDLSYDLVAGLVVGIVTVPQAIAYAFLAGLPPETGLYACLLPMVLYAFLGSSRQLVVGPVAVAALMVADTIRNHADQYGHDAVGIAAVLCMQAGLLLWLLRLFQVGGIVNVLSRPVIGGFINGAVILIVISQIPALTGIPASPSSGPLTNVLSMAQRMSDAHALTIAIGLASLLFLWLFPLLVKRSLMRRKTPREDSALTRIGPIFVALGSILLVLVAGFETSSVGYIPAGLPSIKAPPFRLDLWIDLAPSAALIAIVAYVESFSVGSALASRQRKRVNSHQELIALGAANLGAAFTSAYPVAGSFSRSSVNYAAGGRTPISSFASALVILIALMWLTPLFQLLPHAALAAIIIISVVGLVEFKDFKTHWRFYRLDVMTHVVTLVSVLAFGVETGLLTGVCVSILLFIRRSSRPHITTVGRLGGSTHFRNIERYDAETWPKVVAVRVDESLYFANANRVEDRVLKIVETNAEAQHILLVCSSINFIDTSGLEMLRRVNESLRLASVKLHLSEVKGPVMDRLAETAFARELSGEMFFTTDEAMQKIDEESSGEIANS
ncbi:MAG: sulfate permease [Pseudomonadota bacterium]|nr:sulfate permease [Pseudomonadota bacterium]